VSQRSSGIRVVDQYKIQEYEEKRGTGIIRLLSELQWIRNAEEDNDKPYEERRILPKKRVVFFLAGSGIAFSLHLTTSLLGFFSSLLAGAVDPRLGEFIAVFSILFKITVLVGFPLWLLKTYHLWDRGITRQVLTDVVFYGYVFSVAFLTLVSMFFYIAFAFGLFVSKDSQAVKWLVEHFPFLTSWIAFAEYPVQLLLILIVPYWYAKKLDREHRFTTKPYTLLDEIPFEE